MVIDFEKIAEAHLEGFKGGQGKLDTRNYVDDKVKTWNLVCSPVRKYWICYRKGRYGRL